MRKFTVAVIQLDSQNNKKENMETICKFIDESAKKGADLVSLPEVMNFVGTMTNPEDMPETIPGYTTDILVNKAKEHNIFIHSGSFAEKKDGDTRFYNTSVLITNKGEIIGKYRKLHTFDVILPDGTLVNESERVHPGEDVVTIDTDLGKMGFSICYDIRFSEMYRIMALEGAEMLFTPASFTMPTGKDHWEAILRTRAIENGCYVIAAGQIGIKKNFVAYGNSMIIDPWGNVIARASNKPGIALAEIDLDYVYEIREKIPSLKNRRSDIYEVKRK